MVYNHKNIKHWEKGATIGLNDANSFIDKLGSSTVIVENKFIQNEYGKKMFCNSLGHVSSLANISLLSKSLKEIGALHDLNLMPLYKTVFYFHTDSEPELEDVKQYFNSLLELEKIKSCVRNFLDLDLITPHYEVELKMLGLNWEKIRKMDEDEDVCEIEDQYFELRYNQWENGKITTQEFIEKARKVFDKYLNK